MVHETRSRRKTTISRLINNRRKGWNRGLEAARKLCGLPDIYPHSPWINVTPILQRCIKSYTHTHPSPPPPPSRCLKIGGVDASGWCTSRGQNVPFVLAIHCDAWSLSFFFFIPGHANSRRNLVRVWSTIKHRWHDWFPAVYDYY